MFNHKAYVVWLRESGKLPGLTKGSSAVLILYLMSRWLDRRAEAFPKVSLIMSELGLARRPVQKALAHIKEQKVAFADDWIGAPGRKISVYTPPPDCGFEKTPPEKGGLPRAPKASISAPQPRSNKRPTGAENSAPIQNRGTKNPPPRPETAAKRPDAVSDVVDLFLALKAPDAKRSNRGQARKLVELVGVEAARKCIVAAAKMKVGNQQGAAAAAMRGLAQPRKDVEPTSGASSEVERLIGLWRSLSKETKTDLWERWRAGGTYWPTNPTLADVRNACAKPKFRALLESAAGE